MQHARAALKALDVDGDGRISLLDVRQAVQDICLKRKNLSLTLHDTHGVIGKLERIFGVVMHLVAASCYLIIFQVRLNLVVHGHYGAVGVCALLQGACSQLVL